MKWFKHFTDSLDDPFIQELLDKYGAQGYLAYFGLMEIIAKENGNHLTGKLSINPSYLRRKFRISITKLQQIFNFCSTSNKLLFNFSNKLWDFSVPKLIELKDNYTKDLQVTCKKLSNHKEEEVEEDKKKKKIKRKHIYGKHKNVLLTEEEYSKLQDRFNSRCEYWIDTLSEGVALKGYVYKSHYLAILKWAKNNPESGEIKWKQI